MIRRTFLTILTTISFVFLLLGSLILVNYLVKEPVCVQGLNISTSLWDKGFFKAEGTWELCSSSNPGDSLPINRCIIECNKKTGYCDVNNASIIDTSRRFLILSNDTYSIIKWGDRWIVAVSKDLPYGQNVLIVDRETRIIETRFERLCDDRKNCPDRYRHYDPKRIDRLVDGYDLSHEPERKRFIMFAWAISLIYFVGYVYSLCRIWRGCSLRNILKKDSDINLL